jgi:hypothetical protein
MTFERHFNMFSVMNMQPKPGQRCRIQYRRSAFRDRRKRFPAPFPSLSLGKADAHLDLRPIITSGKLRAKLATATSIRQEESR